MMVSHLAVIMASRCLSDGSSQKSSRSSLLCAKRHRGREHVKGTQRPLSSRAPHHQLSRQLPLIFYQLPPCLVCTTFGLYGQL